MITFDIETYKDVSDDNYVAWKTAGISAPSNYKDPEKIAQNIADQKVDMLNKFALSPLTGKIILIGCLIDKQPELPFEFTKYNIAGKDVFYTAFDDEEKDMLTKFWMLVGWNNLQLGGDMLSFNGKAFDLPFLLNRSAILDVKPPMKISMQKHLSKYQHQPHLDLYNWFGSGSLVEWSYRFGISSSLQRDGDKIGGWYEANQMNLIKDKNMIDLAQTNAIYQRIKDWL